MPGSQMPAAAEEFSDRLPPAVRDLKGVYACFPKKWFACCFLLSYLLSGISFPCQFAVLSLSCVRYNTTPQNLCCLHGKGTSYFLKDDTE